MYAGYFVQMGWLHTSHANDDGEIKLPHFEHKNCTERTITQAKVEAQDPAGKFLYNAKSADVETALSDLNKKVTGNTGSTGNVTTGVVPTALRCRVELTMTATFMMPLNLHSFPLDKHFFYMVLEADNVRNVKLVPFPEREKTGAVTIDPFFNTLASWEWPFYLDKSQAFNKEPGSV